MFVHLTRYARMYHRRQHEYGHVIAPGHNSQTVLFACGNIITPTARTDLRYLRWYERLLNR